MRKSKHSSNFSEYNLENVYPKKVISPVETNGKFRNRLLGILPS